MAGQVVPHVSRFEVNSYDVDLRGLAKLKTLTNVVQEAAGRHATELGFSIHQLGEGLTWMLSRVHLDFERWPRWHDVLEVETWPVGVRGLTALRDFRFRTAEGALIGVGTSAWMIVDMRRRRPARVPPALANLFPKEAPRALDDPFDRLPEPSLDPEAPRFPVRFSQLDLNRHANQSAYVDWAVDALPERAWDSYRPRAIEIAFRQEARMGDEILADCEEAEPGVFLHRLRRAEDDREFVRLRTRWSTEADDED